MGDRRRLWVSFSERLKRFRGRRGRLANKGFGKQFAFPSKLMSTTHAMTLALRFHSRVSKVTSHDALI